LPQFGDATTLQPIADASNRTPGAGSHADGQTIAFERPSSA
jgi:hypothetical protein